MLVVDGGLFPGPLVEVDVDGFVELVDALRGFSALGGREVRDCAVDVEFVGA